MHRAFLRGGGFSAEEVRSRPVIGIANSASDLNPCNMGLALLVKEVKRGVKAAGGLPLEFPTISISEPFTRPTSLYLRNLMSMDVEEMISVSPIDGVVLMGGCDKTVPAQIMGAISAGKPSVMVTAGPRPVSCHRGNASVTVDDAWPFCDRRRVGEVDDQEWLEFEGNLNVGVGTCNVMGTASTMAAIAEVLGFALPGSSLAEAGSAERRRIAYETGIEAVAAVQRGQAPRGLISMDSLENAFRAVMALGGSTNSVIHLEAFAGRAGLQIGIEKLQTWSRDTPYLTNVLPGGEYTLPDFAEAGGLAGVLVRIRDLLKLDTHTARGTKWRDELSAVSAVENTVIRERTAPEAKRSSLVMLKGNLAPNGAVLKTAGAEDPRFFKHRGRVVVFDGLDDLNDRIDDPELDVNADSILVLRGLGAVGAPGMPEVGHIPIPAKLHRQGVTEMVRLSDARMSGTSTGVVVLHISPEAAVGGPIAYLQDGDEVRLDAETGCLEHFVDDQEFASRKPFRPADPPTRGFAKLHVSHVLQPEYGCDFDFLREPSAPIAQQLTSQYQHKAEG
ncbi:dihydroxy-acid dehydratase [Nesterenkonia lutea]|uniref:Dihydroxy-acid dehydratase n=2 Tax=Nesterenkonia lutea TaxID=272919 RepID=A0ABR9JEM6_9MICC|nr:dihydroxy-acid dehydratase [Nesterenkonia lutea]